VDAVTWTEIYQPFGKSNPGCPTHYLVSILIITNVIKAKIALLSTI